MGMSNATFDRQFAAASRKGEERLLTQPLATAVRYDRRLRKLAIDLNNGCTMLVPIELIEGLGEAKQSDLADAKVLGPGTSVSWPKLDLQLSVAGLLNGQFGRRAWMASRVQRSRRAVGAKTRGPLKAG